MEIKGTARVSNNSAITTSFGEDPTVLKPKQEWKVNGNVIGCTFVDSLNSKLFNMTHYQYLNLQIEGADAVISDIDGTFEGVNDEGEETFTYKEVTVMSSEKAVWTDRDVENAVFPDGYEYEVTDKGALKIKKGNSLEGTYEYKVSLFNLRAPKARVTRRAEEKALLANEYADSTEVTNARDLPAEDRRDLFNKQLGRSLVESCKKKVEFVADRDLIIRDVANVETESEDEPVK